MPAIGLRHLLPRGFAPLLVAALLAGAGPAAGQSAPAPSPAPAPAAPPLAVPPSPETVVATVDGEEVRFGDVLALMSRMPERFRAMPLPALYPSLLQQAVEGLLIRRAAAQKGYADHPVVLQRLEQAKGQFMSEAYLTEAVQNQVTEEAVRARYDEIAAAQGGEEVKARHILLESEADAEAVIAALADGADFAELAAERSIGPSAPNGGDLGWFGEGDMVPEFAEAAFALDPGTQSEAPVKTQFGWHVILVEDRRTAGPPPFEEIRDELARDVLRGLLAALTNDLRQAAKIELFNLDGTPLEPPAAPAN